MNTERSVGMVLDFVCVHSYIGFTRLLRAVNRFRDGGGVVEVTFLPYQLRPDTSPVGEPLFEQHKRERGEAVAREIAADTTLGVADGLRINLGGAVFTNTFDAHRILAQAAGQGRGEQFAERVFRAYFTDGVNIADQATLSRLAEETGVVIRDTGAAELRAELDRFRQLDNDSVPAFRFDSGIVLTGEQTEDALLAALR